MISVIPTGLEPVTYALGKRRSDPAELWDRNATNLPDDGALRKCGAENGSEMGENPWETPGGRGE